MCTSAHGLCWYWYFPGVLTQRIQPQTLSIQDIRVRKRRRRNRDDTAESHTARDLQWIPWDGHLWAYGAVSKLAKRHAEFLPGTGTTPFQLASKPL